MIHTLAHMIYIMDQKVFPATRILWYEYLE
jgi:hypothetical protein